MWVTSDVGRTRKHSCTHSISIQKQRHLNILSFLIHRVHKRARKVWLYEYETMIRAYRTSYKYGICIVCQTANLPLSECFSCRHRKRNFLPIRFFLFFFAAGYALLTFTESRKKTKKSLHAWYTIQQDFRLLVSFCACCDSHFVFSKFSIVRILAVPFLLSFECRMKNFSVCSIQMPCTEWSGEKSGLESCLPCTVRTMSHGCKLSTEAARTKKKHSIFVSDIEISTTIIKLCEL